MPGFKSLNKVSVPGASLSPVPLLGPVPTGSHLRFSEFWRSWRSDGGGVDLVVFGMGADKADEDDAGVVVDFYDESVGVAFHVEHYPSCQARRRRMGSDA